MSKGLFLVVFFFVGFKDHTVERPRMQSLRLGAFGVHSANRRYRR
jgi:hypothetical protein